MHHARSIRVPRAIAYAALAVLLGIASLTLSQCTQVSDTLTGVALTNGAPPGKCISDCNRTHQHLLLEQRKLHKDNLQNCGSDAQCIAAENARHDAEQNRLEQARRDCRANCHRQGGGHAG